MADADVSPALRAALAPPASTPGLELARLVRGRRVHVAAAAALAMATGAGIVAEALAARAVLDAGAAGGRLALLIAAVVVVAGLADRPA